MNGLAYDGGVLSQGESVQLGDRPIVLNFGGGITVALCHSKEQESLFEQSGGMSVTFLGDDTIEDFEKREVGQSYYDGSKNSQLGFFGSSMRFFRSLPFYHRIALLFTVFLVLLTASLMFKLVLPLFL